MLGSNVLRIIIRSMSKREGVQDKALPKKVAWYVTIGEDLYKRGFSTSLLLKCVNIEQGEYVMNELQKWKWTL